MMGSKSYPEAKKLMLTADCGGAMDTEYGYGKQSCKS